MSETLFAFACILFVLAPILLVVGLIRPSAFKRLTGVTSRKRIILASIAIFSISIVLAGFLGPDPTPQAQTAKPQQSQQARPAAQQTKTPAKIASAVPPAQPEITSLQKNGAGYVVAGKAPAKQKFELQVTGKKYKVVAGQDGQFRSAIIDGVSPYGTIGLYKLKKSFLHTDAIKQQVKYYSFFASEPKLSSNKLAAHITEVKADGNNFKLQGFYLANTKLSVAYKGSALKAYTTDKNGFFVFTGIPRKSDVMALSLRAQTSTVSSQEFVYTPTLRLVAVKPAVQVVSTTQVIPFQKSTENDSSLTKGSTRVVTSGRNGTKTLTYRLTYIAGKQVNKQLVSSVNTVAPVTQITEIGTYTAPTPVYSAPSSGSGYTNSAGNYVPSPSSNPAGASARCGDGTYSYSQSRRGTCSHHGGVSVWY